MIIKEIPYFERPREKALKDGVTSLSNSELLAILLETGSKDKNVLDLSKELLYSLGNLSDLEHITKEELKCVKGIGDAKALKILVSIEIGKRIISEKKIGAFYKNPIDVFNYYYPLLKNKKEEHLYGMYLDVKGKLIASVLITKGTINQTIIDHRLIFKWAYKFSSYICILVHNHPSGDSTPSVQDIQYTKELLLKAKQQGIEIVDHIIIGDDYTSLREFSKSTNLF